MAVKQKRQLGAGATRKKLAIIPSNHYTQRVTAYQEKQQQQSCRTPHLVLEDGAGLGDVGVEVFDHVVELLFDYAASQLERERKAAVVEGEVFGEEGEALDGFVLGEVG